jgi:hypothetical protein
MAAQTNKKRIALFRVSSQLQQQEELKTGGFVIKQRMKIKKPN